MEFNLVVPGLLSPKLHMTNHIYLANLMRRAKITPLDLSYSEIILGIDYKIGSSIATQIAKQNELEPYQNYLVCEPTNLLLDGNSLVISESSLLQLDYNECNSIISDLNLHFGARAKFFYINDMCWIVGVNELNYTVASVSILDILGQDINQYLSKNIQVNQIINETQMILANHDVNKVRDDEGSLNFNSIWLWDRALVKNIDCYGNTILASGELSGVVTTQKYKSVLNVKYGLDAILVLEQLYSCSRLGDLVSWIDNANTIENDFWRLIYKVRNNIKCINLYLPYNNITFKVQITSLDRFKLWRNNNFNKLIKDYHEI